MANINVPKTIKYHEAIFENYHICEVTLRFLNIDYEDPINSYISIDKQVKERFDYLPNLEIVNIDVIKTVNYQRTHMVHSIYSTKYLQKVEEDDGTYFYRSTDFGMNTDKIFYNVPFVTRNGKDYFIGNHFECEILEIPSGHFKDYGKDVENDNRNAQLDDLLS